MADCPVTGFDCITCEPGACDLKGKLKGIKAPKGEGNGYNMPGGKKKLAARIKDAKRKGVSHD
jgi:hypothetical protein